MLLAALVYFRYNWHRFFISHCMGKEVRICGTLYVVALTTTTTIKPEELKELFIAKQNKNKKEKLLADYPNFPSSVLFQITDYEWACTEATCVFGNTEHSEEQNWVVAGELQEEAFQARAGLLKIPLCSVFSSVGMHSQFAGMNQYSSGFARMLVWSVCCAPCVQSNGIRSCNRVGARLDFRNTVFFLSGVLLWDFQNQILAFCEQAKITFELVHPNITYLWQFLILGLFC